MWISFAKASLVLVIISLLASCSAGNGNAFARQACAKGTPVIDGKKTTTDNWRGSRDNYEAAANLAAKAANADSKWNELADALSKEVDIFDEGGPIIDRIASSKFTSADDSRKMQDLVKRAEGIEGTIRAQCRKARLTG